jgi:hypothetical protein
MEKELFLFSQGYTKLAEYSFELWRLAVEVKKDTDILAEALKVTVAVYKISALKQEIKDIKKKPKLSELEKAILLFKKVELSKEVNNLDKEVKKFILESRHDETDETDEIVEDDM